MLERLLGGVDSGLHGALLAVSGLYRPGIVAGEPSEDGLRHGALDFRPREEGRGGGDGTGSGGGERGGSRSTESSAADEMPFGLISLWSTTPVRMHGLT